MLWEIIQSTSLHIFIHIYILYIYVYHIYTYLYTHIYIITLSWTWSILPHIAYNDIASRARQRHSWHVAGPTT